jgi:hypothetical protein
LVREGGDQLLALHASALVKPSEQSGDDLAPPRSSCGVHGPEQTLGEPSDDLLDTGLVWLERRRWSFIRTVWRSAHDWRG